MNGKALVTVVTRNYAHFALALADSVKQHHPDIDVYICMIDRPPTELQDVPEGVQVFYADELKIPQWKRFCFQYTPFELSCALKPFAMEQLMTQGYDEVIYLDSDMRVYGRLDEVFVGLEQHSIVLTPHLLRPFPNDDKLPKENLFLMAGAFNGGFVAVRNDTTGNRFVAWWRDRLKSDGYKDLAGSIFCDQKWLSLVPGLFENFLAIRNPGYNTGHWTLHQFKLSSDSDGRPLIGGQPIVLFHFSNFNPGNPDEFSRCQTRFAADSLPELTALVADYHAAVHAKNQLQCDQWGYGFSCLSDGTKIHLAWREAIRRDLPQFADVDDPFDVQTNPRLQSKYQSIEAKAYKWRSDWRLHRELIYPEQVQPPKKNVVKKNEFKKFLHKIGLRKKAA